MTNSAAFVREGVPKTSGAGKVLKRKKSVHLRSRVMAVLSRFAVYPKRFQLRGDARVKVLTLKQNQH